MNQIQNHYSKEQPPKTDIRLLKPTAKWTIANVYFQLSFDTMNELSDINQEIMFMQDTIYKYIK